MFSALFPSLLRTKSRVHIFKMFRFCLRGILLRSDLKTCNTRIQVENPSRRRFENIHELINYSCVTYCRGALFRLPTTIFAVTAGFASFCVSAAQFDGLLCCPGRFTFLLQDVTVMRIEIVELPF